MKLFLTVDAMKRASARSICVIIPHYWYARQDRKTRTRESISSKVIANILERVWVNHLITFNLHSDQIQWYFDIEIDSISTRRLFAEYIKNKKNINLDNTVAVSTDAGGAKATQKFASKLNIPFAIMHKHRSKHNTSEVVGLIWDVKDKTIIIYDDIIDTAGSVCNAKNELIKQWADSDNIYLVATHPVFSGPAIERLKEANFKEIIVTNSIPVNQENILKNLTICSIAPLISKIITNIQTDQSVSILFTDINKQ
jgi:ribose-phosphate pyrophosphokinase